MQFFDPNYYRMFLQELESSADSESLRSVLEALGGGNRRVINHLENLGIGDGGDQGLLELLTDDLCERLEDTLGIAFVVCQQRITSTVATMRRLHEHAESAGVRLPTLPRDKKKIMKAHSEIIASDVSAVEVIDSMANYWKHRDEWLGTWEGIRLRNDNRKAIRTIGVIEVAGAKSGFSANFREVSKTLGLPDFAVLDRLLNLVEEWRGGLARAVNTELLQCKLI